MKKDRYTIITRSVPPCAYCEKAKALLDSKGIAYTEYDLSANEGSIELFKILGYKTMPVITQGDRVIGGYDELSDRLSPKIYYMRDNHTFKLLDNDPDIAMRQLEHEFVSCGFSFGLLRSDNYKTKDSVSANGCWDSFKNKAIKYLER